MQLHHQLLAVLALNAAHAWGGMQLFTADDFSSLSSDCVSALTAELSCTLMETGSTMYHLTVNMTVDLLDQMCTDECKKSIASYRAAVESACANDEYEDSYESVSAGNSSEVYRPIVLPDYYFTNYNQRCLKDSGDRYCLFHLQSTDSQDECDACGLQMFQAELSNSYLYNDDLADQYSSLTSSCGASTLGLPTPTSVALASPSMTVPTPTACADRSATIQPEDTCDTFAAANNVSTWRMLIENGLNGGCTNFPSNGTLCVTGHCQTHLVQPDNTCAGLAAEYDITITQFITWNSVLNAVCSNFDVVIGHQVCVSYPGNATSELNTYATGAAGGTATTAAPIPTDVVAGTNVNCGKYYHVKDNDYCQGIAMAQGITVSDLLFLNPELNANCSNLYNNYSYCVQPVGNIETYSGYGGTTATGSVSAAPTFFYGTRIAWDDLPTATSLTPWIPIATPITAPLANNTREDCDKYSNNFAGSIPCDWIARGVALSDFASWNPSVNVYDCYLTNNTRYCTLLGPGYYLDNMKSDNGEIYADVPSNAAANSTKQCYDWYDRTKEDSCDTILAYADIDMTAFYAWNPSVKSDCSNLWLNTSYCVSSSGFDDTFYPGNSSSTSTSLPTATSTCASATVSAPGPTQTGIPCDCNKYTMHDEDGIYCEDIATQNRISLEEFYEWNPSLNGDCSGLWLNYAYCVGVTSSTSPSKTTTTTSTPTTTSSTTCATVKPPGPTQSGIPCTCNKYLMQADGVYCYDMAAESDVTLEELYEWNPALADDCSGLWANYAYCVGVL